MPLPSPEFSQISADTPSAARIYDYYLGGYHNFTVDRETAERVIAIYPDVCVCTQVNRAFLARAVRFCLAQGIDQFLDLGSGIPTAGNVHEIAQAENPEARVVYVDIDPIAVAQGRALLRGNPRAAVVEADASEPERILERPEVRSLIDFDKPMAVLTVALLNFVPDDGIAAHIVRTLRDAMPRGSVLVLSHGTREDASPAMIAQISALYERSPNPVRFRSKAEVSRFFEGLELIPPGVVFTPAWRPESDEDLFLDAPSRALALAGVARKL